ncbi:uncharacterized protein BT62DRAFT_1073096 [Guyanagaster necrorhizus]|uniref:CSC1/OSCA1-like N-terminal transmembrane domain-containing protein n=1 Tax=Guyanagaster necrorhizus TaxID=856835 RepID=A0A9P7VZ77_9AGAR|nr:uncharacterized protein BT62DRAFT_1073096 [Guyanagaster necrorhizus MCA 3950]KAG7449664.1 hypothetical protein BT62DRAFT_1073096 [Guyanagaster necrorhizus MCA 3950]
MFNWVYFICLIKFTMFDSALLLFITPSIRKRAFRKQLDVRIFEAEHCLHEHRRFPASFQCLPAFSALCSRVPPNGLYVNPSSCICPVPVLVDGGFRRLAVLGIDVDPLGQAAGAERNLTLAAFELQFLIPHRSKYKLICQLKVWYHVEDKPLCISDPFFDRIPPLIHTKEPELIEKIGLDGVSFLQFLSLLHTLYSGVHLNVLECSSYVVTCKTTASMPPSLLVISSQCLSSYWCTSIGVTCYGLARSGSVHPEYTNSFYARSLSITHVPEKFRSDGGINAILNTVSMPYSTNAVHISRQVGFHPESTKYHNQTVRELGAILVKHLKNSRYVMRAFVAALIEEHASVKEIFQNVYTMWISNQISSR